MTDMEALGTFDGTTLAKVPGIVNALTDEQVALLSQYYFLTRSKTQQDAYLYSLQQQGETDEQVNGAKAEIADLLTTMNDQTVACYDQFVPMPRAGAVPRPDLLRQRPRMVLPSPLLRPRVVLRQRLLLSVPAFNAAYAGGWAVPVSRPSTTTVAVSTRRSTTSPTAPTSAAARTWRSGKPTGCGTAATGGTPWLTTGSCIQLMAEATIN